MFLLPERVIGTVENGSTHRQERIKALRCPAHARAFGAGTDDGFAGGLGNSTAQVHPLRTEDRRAHTLCVGRNVVHGSLRETASLPRCRGNGRQSRDGSHKRFRLALFEERTGMCGPARGLQSASPKDGVGHIPDVFFGMIQINDLDRTGEVFSNQLPDPGCPISQDDDLLSVREATLLGKLIEQPIEVSLGRAACHRAQTLWRRRIHVPTRGEFRPPGSPLGSKDGSRFDLAIHVAWTALFLVLHWHAPTPHSHEYPIQFDIQPLDLFALPLLICLTSGLLGLGLNALRLPLFCTSQRLSYRAHQAEGLSG